MTFLLGLVSLLAIIDSSSLLKAMDPNNIDNYLINNKNFAQKQAIDNCSLGYKVTDSIATFTLWSAACLLGLKYKMTAHKIHTAVKE